MRKHGRVLLPFLSEDQLEGFYVQECIGNSFEQFKLEWETKQKEFYKLENSVTAPLVVEAMTSSEQEQFVNDLFISQYKHPENVTMSWLQGITEVVPLKPFVSLEDCEELAKELASTGDHITLCWRSSNKKRMANVQASQKGDSTKLMMLTYDRNVIIKGITMGREKENDEIVFKVHIGRKSPFIELIKIGDRVFLLNGVNRLYTIISAGMKDAKIPCVVLHYENPEGEVAHPYATDIVNGDRPPMMKDFFRDRTYIDIPLKVTMKQLLITAEEDVLPVEFDEQMEM